MDLINLIYVVAGVLIFFGASIFVHEFGHYWVARKAGLKVLSFAIGFGPKIVSWTKNDIEYSLRWIPFGGFVKLPQMITSEAIEGNYQENGEPIPPASPWIKILVALAGPAMNVVFAFAVATIIYFFGLPIPVDPPIIGHVKADSPEAALGIEPGDRIMAVDGESISSWQQVFETTALSRKTDFEVTLKGPSGERTLTLTANSDNPLELKIFNLGSQDHPFVGEVSPDTPADQAGILSGDKFISFAGVPIVSSRQFRDLIQQGKGKEATVVLDRKSQEVQVTLAPKFVEVKGMESGGYYQIGIMFGNHPIQYEAQVPGPAPTTQIIDVVNRTFRTINALFHSSETGVGAKDLSGPVGIMSMLASQFKSDLRLALSFLILVNINLAILNLLPIPVLDGGHIVMSLIEIVLRRPLSLRIVESLTMVCAVFILSLMLYVTYFDFKRLPLFKEMFNQKVEINPAQPLDSSTNAPVIPNKP